MPPNSDKCGKYGTILFTPVNLAFTVLLLMTLAVIWCILCRAAKFIDGRKWNKAFKAVYCFSGPGGSVNGPEVPSDTSATTQMTDMCCFGLHCGD